jgi:hypothetical protein
MRKTRVSMRICVHGVPLSTTWFCPYCCATVDTELSSPRETPEAERVRLLPHARLLVSTALRYPSETCVSGRNHKVTCAGCIVSLAIHARSAFSESRSDSSRYIAQRQKKIEIR